MNAWGIILIAIGAGVLWWAYKKTLNLTDLESTLATVALGAGLSKTIGGSGTPMDTGGESKSSGDTADDGAGSGDPDAVLPEGDVIGAE